MNYLQKLFGLEGKAAIVTGAAGDIGNAIANGLRKAGANVISVDKDKKISEHDSFVNIDITNTKDVGFYINRILEQNKINILVNCAGITFANNLFDYKESDWEQTYQVNLKAPYNLSKLVAKNMIDNKINGSIINITSLAAEVGLPDNPAYIAFKGALKQLTKSLAYDLGKYGIRANNIAPGYIHTNMTDKSYKDEQRNRLIKSKTLLNRWGEPDDIAGAVIFLASDASAYITGQDIIVDGGWLTKGI